MHHVLKVKALLLPAIIFLSVPGVSGATSYSYELSNDQPWTDAASTGTTTEYVTVRTYVPGSDTVNFRSIPLYTPTYASEANVFGDVVGSVFSVYGSGTTAYVDPYDGKKRTVVYPATQILHTRLLAVNDERLAIGNYNVLGGHANGKGFIYDVSFDQYTEVVAPDTEWTDLSDINNLGQIVGTSINNDGATRKGFVYDCANGFEMLDVPGSTWTVPRKIDDSGTVYGLVSGITDATYFIARPDTHAASTCSLVPRDDATDPVFFANTTRYELSGDNALGVKIADFDGGSIEDLLVYHEVGKTILYLGEENFDGKIKYFGDEFNSLAEGVDIASQWDFNNDGFLDRVSRTGSENLLYFSKDDGSYFYVPQVLPDGDLKFGDLNGDNRVDIATFSRGYALIQYQTAQPPVEVSPTPSEPVDNADPAIDGSASVTGDTPAVDTNAQEIESADTIAQVTENRLSLSSGKALWLNSDSIIKLNDAPGFEAGQYVEFKAWENLDGTLVGIKIEVN
jgi:hypothetical protein